MKKYCVFIIVLCTMLFLSLSSYAQEATENEHVKVEVISSDSICLPKITLDFYNEVNFLEHAYDYDRKVKISQLKCRQRDVGKIAYATIIGIVYINSYLAVEYDWNLWIDVPCATAVAFASFYSFMIWQNRLQAKIDALSAETVYLCPISDDVNFGLAHFSSNMSYNAFGIGIKMSF